MPSGKPVKRVAVVMHNHAEVVKDAVSRLERLAESLGIEVGGEDDGLDLAVTLGGDGSMLRAFHRFLDTGVPVIGVNFGRVGFLTSIEADELERGLERVFRGDFVVVELPAYRLPGRPGRP
jgi:NAD kinase